MKTYRDSQLKKIIERKGILLDHNGRAVIRNYDYFQVVNAYKYIFIDQIEDLQKIKYKVLNNGTVAENYYRDFFSIKKYSDNLDLYKQICVKICEKYGLDLSKKLTLTDLEDEISGINYIRHIYCSGCNYLDFVRLYLQEHELRNILLKYVLFLEERIKKIFISELNNLGADANCLADIDNYNLCRETKSKALDSLSQIIKMHKNKKSKPINHKIERELTVPYWILINELSLNQTLVTISMLKTEWRMIIQKSLVKSLTIFKFSSATPNNDSEYVAKFNDILFVLGNFRNFLAHNQPIYCYNVLTNFPKFKRAYPRLDTHSKKFLKNKASGMNYFIQQQQQNVGILASMEKFFGSDFYNNVSGRRKNKDVNLSWIIYVISRITNIIDKNNTLSSDIAEIFKKYNIIYSYNNEYKSGTYIAEIIDLVDCMNTNKIRKSDINKLTNLVKKAKKQKKISKFNSFSRVAKYTYYTGIDNNFLLNL